MKRKSLLACFLALAMTISMAGCGGSSKSEESSQDSGTANKPQILTMTFAPAEGSPHHEAGLEFAKLVKEYTNGAYEVEIYPNSSLSGGNQFSAIEMVQKGTISCGLLSVAVQAGIEPNLNAICIPFLWKNNDSIDQAFVPGSDVDQQLNRILGEKGFHCVAYAENGFRELTNSKKEIKTPEDMKNIKFRVLGSKILLDTFTAFGANPVDINFAELFTALQQGTVDGQENPVSTIIMPQRFYEVQDYLTLWNYSYEPHPLQFNKELWDSFTPETQEQIQKAAVEACDLQKKLARESLEADLKTMEEKGVQIAKLSNDEKAAFKTIADGVVEEYLPTFDKDFIDALYAANE